MAGKEKKKKNRSGRVLLTIILIVCIGVAAYAAYNLISIGLEYKVGEDEYAALQEYTHKVPEDAEDSDEAQEADEDESQPVKKKVKPPITVDFDKLIEINSDFVGWFYMEAEDISYPLVHYEDNDFYLHRTFEKTDNFAGTLFVEALNNPDFKDPNTIIYGHNMRNLSMFGKLKLLVQNEDYKKSDIFWILTPEGSYKYRMINIETVNVSSDVYTLFSFPSQDVVEYIKARNAESSVPFELGEIGENSKVVTLSTCVGAGGSERLVVQGLLVGGDIEN